MANCEQANHMCTFIRSHTCISNGCYGTLILVLLLQVSLAFSVFPQQIEPALAWEREVQASLRKLKAVTNDAAYSQPYQHMFLVVAVPKSAVTGDVRHPS